MLLFSFLLLIPRMCISLGCRAGDWQQSQSCCLMELMKSANHQYKQIQCYCRTVWAPASFFLWKWYFIYCQHRGNAMLSSPFHECAFASLAAVPPSWLLGPPAESHILWDMNHTARKLGHCSYFSEAEGCWGRNVPVLNLLNTVPVPGVVSGPGKAEQVKAESQTQGCGECLGLWGCARLQCWAVRQDRAGVVRTQHGTNWVEEVELWFSFGECDVISGIDPEFCLNQLCLWENDIADGECHFSVM